MKLIVGLGNPGRRYKNCRHNIGIRTISGLAREYKIKLRSDKYALYKEGRGKIAGRDFLLAYPLAFMNLSGESVHRLVKKYKIPLADLLVVCDDLDLEIGNIRIRPHGSSGGHKGIKSIIEHLKSETFARLRIGIGRPTSKIDIKDFVLSKFNLEETELIVQALHRAIQCSKVWLSQGIKEAMNQFNRKRRDR